MKRTLAGLALAAVATGALLYTPTPEGCGARCCHRPTPDADCRRRNPHTGVAEDYGDATMPGTHAVGAGCVPAECVVGRGVEMLDGGAP